MTMRAAIALTVLLSLGFAGCGGGDETVTTRPTPTTTTSQPGKATLERAVRTALERNRRLSIYVLWNNRIPAWAMSSTQGEALEALRAAAVNRRKRGIRVRLLQDRFQVLSIRLDPSYGEAVAVARGRQRVRPYGRDGKPAGRAVQLDERVRVELRRLRDSTRFIVWRVTILR